MSPTQQTRRRRIRISVARRREGIMGRSSDEDRWLEDFSIVLRPDVIRSTLRKPGFEVFAGSKLLAGLWLMAIAAAAGALAGMCAGPESLSRVWPTFVGLLVVGPAMW